MRIIKNIYEIFLGSIFKYFFQGGDQELIFLLIKYK